MRLCPSFSLRVSKLRLSPRPLVVQAIITIWTLNSPVQICVFYHKRHKHKLQKESKVKGVTRRIY